MYEQPTLKNFIIVIIKMDDSIDKDSQDMKHSVLKEGIGLVLMTFSMFLLLHLGVDSAVPNSKAQDYRPAFLDHFEKLEENQRNLDGNKRGKGDIIRSDPSTQFPKNFLGPMDFDFVSI